MRWLRKNKLQLEQGSSVSLDSVRSLGGGVQTEVLSHCPAFEQEVSGTSSGLPKVRKVLVILFYSAPHVPANHDIDLFSEIFQIFLHFLRLW